MRRTRRHCTVPDVPPAPLRVSNGREKPFTCGWSKGAAVRAGPGAARVGRGPGRGGTEGAD